MMIEIRFGVCPHCRKQHDGWVSAMSAMSANYSLATTTYWFVCKEHKVKWCVGERHDLGPDWDDFTEIAYLPSVMAGGSYNDKLDKPSVIVAEGSTQTDQSELDAVLIKAEERMEEIAVSREWTNLECAISDVVEKFPIYRGSIAALLRWEADEVEMGENDKYPMTERK